MNMVEAQRTNIDSGNRSPWFQTRVHVALLSFCWLINLSSLLAILLWLRFDPHVEDIYRGVLHRWNHGQVFSSRLPFESGTTLAIAIISAVFVSMIGIAASLVVGSRTHRSIRTWCAFIALSVAWFVTHQQLPNVFWNKLVQQGGILRLELEPVAFELEHHWPMTDGSLSGLGAFRTDQEYLSNRLILSTGESNHDQGYSIVSVERTPGKSIRFELASDRECNFIERHFSNSVPASFLGGFDEQVYYSLDRRADLGDGWYLVRYQRIAEFDRTMK